MCRATGGHPLLPPSSPLEAGAGNLSHWQLRDSTKSPSFAGQPIAAPLLPPTLQPPSAQLDRSTLLPPTPPRQPQREPSPHRQREPSPHRQREPSPHRQREPSPHRQREQSPNRRVLSAAQVRHRQEAPLLLPSPSRLPAQQAINSAAGNIGSILGSSPLPMQAPIAVRLLLNDGGQRTGPGGGTTAIVQASTVEEILILAGDALPVRLKLYLFMALFESLAKLT